jgi:hypothetical protein
MYVCTHLRYVCVGAAARAAYYSLDPGAFYERFDPWLDRFLRYIFYPFIFSAYSLVLYFWCVRWPAHMSEDARER